MKAAPFTSWDDVPLVCAIEITARVLNRSVTSIRRALHHGTMTPAPMPRVGKTAPYQWSKEVLREHVDGGYRKHVATAGRRNYFVKARSSAA